MSVLPFEARFLNPLRELVNLHVAAAVPGWVVSTETLSRHLEREESEYIVDPWVLQRTTLCVPDGYRVAAAVHLLRYADRPDVKPDWRGSAEIGWLVFRPGQDAAAAEVLAAARAQFDTWQATALRGWGAGLPVPSLWGVPDAWPHVDAALRAAGWAPDPAVHQEALYGGWLNSAGPPVVAPVPGLSVRRTVGANAIRFTANRAGEPIAWFETAIHGTWADAWDLHVQPDLRNQGIGTWLVQNAAEWLRLAGCERILIAVTAADEAAGAGRFYDHLGWRLITREVDGWRPMSP